MENQDYSQQNGGQPLQSSPNNPAVGTPDYWGQQQESVSSVNWEDDAIPPMPSSSRQTSAEIDVSIDSYSVESFSDMEIMEEKPVNDVEPEVAPTTAPGAPVPPPYVAESAVTPADIEGIYEAVNSVFEKVEKFQDIIKIQNKTIDRFSKGIVLDARKPLLMEICDLYETVMFGIQEDDKAVTDHYSSEERCRILRAKLDELLEVIKCTLEDNQVEIKSHPTGTDELEPYQTVTGRETTDDIYRFADFDSTTSAIYLTDRTGFVVKTTEMSSNGTCKVVEHILRPEEVTKIILRPGAIESVKINQ